MERSIWILIACCLLTSGCRNNKEHPVNFYYWKTNVSIGTTEQEYFKSLQCTKIYMRFFDVDRQGKDIVPLAKISLFDAEVLHAEYIPVVFITNRTFDGITEQQAEQLAKDVTELIEKIRTKNSIPAIDEIQIDCDWTESTRNAYFGFLKTLKEYSLKRISCTLRLHQIKFKNKTGIPPVDKGYLMCYATSDPRETSVPNSILDMALLKDYTADIDSYPLDFDVALPIFSWAVVTNHLGKIKLINNVDRNNLDTTYLKSIGNDSFEVTDDFFFQGLYLNKGFQLRLEYIPPALLKEARQYLNRKVKKAYGIVYFHLDQPFLQQYSIQELEPDL